MRSILFSAVLTAGAALSASAFAAPVSYFASSAVSDALHSGGSDHSLWMPFFESLPGTPLNGNANGSDFGFSPDGLFTINDEGAAILSGRIVSQVDPAYVFDVLISFVGLAGPGPSGPKKELKASSYIENGGPIDTSTWSHFRLTEGTIVGSGSASGLSFSVTERPLDGVYPGQFGVGANGKNGNLGFSVWFFTTVNAGCTNSLCASIARLGPRAGDVNIDLVETPLPAGILLFGTGLAAFAARRRRA